MNVICKQSKNGQSTYDDRPFLLSARKMNLEAGSTIPELDAELESAFCFGERVYRSQLRGCDRSTEKANCLRKSNSSFGPSLR